MKDLNERTGFTNRHIAGAPQQLALIEIVHKDIEGEHLFQCVWKPFNKDNYSGTELPANGFLGTAQVISGRYSGIGFNAWEQNNSEFIYYRKLGE